MELTDEPGPDLGALEAIRGLYGASKRELARLPADDQEATRSLARLETQLLELNTRRALGEAADEVRSFVAGMREHQRLKSAESAINTRRISAKAAELHAKHITERYARLVDEELGELAFRRRRPILMPKTNKATVELRLW